ncbi:MAG TPA: LysM domain-containing protein [Gaiellaceae bacterium]|nr:LysM domain-containing protein [Gaiellaceae bacterium]
MVELSKRLTRRWGLPGRSGGRNRLARYAAPAAFLLAVTGIVLAVRGSLRSDSGPDRSTPAITRPAPGAAARHRTVVPKRWYVIQTGDTLGAIAGRFGTTVDRLLRLNPGVEPTALAPGTHLRIQ